MCSVELDTLRRKTCRDVTSLGHDQDPTSLSPEEMEFVRVSSAVIMLKEKEESLDLDLKQAVWRQAVFSRNLKNPSDECKGMDCVKGKEAFRQCWFWWTSVPNRSQDNCGPH